MFEDFGLTAPAPLSITTLVVNLTLAGVLAFVIGWHYHRFGRTYSNREDLAWVFPLLVLATCLVISVVKSSLALSLGLVGALSIIRFRTPIKEPEELAYLFLAIAVGLGMGADQRMATFVGFLMIMAIMTARSSLMTASSPRNLYLNVESSQQHGNQDVFRTINEVLGEYVPFSDMRRLDVRDGVVHATYFIDCRDSENVADLVDGLNRRLPGAGVSLVEQRGIPGA